MENAGIQSVYNMVETHALHKDTLVKVEDETLPDMERMRRKLGDRSQEFLQEVYQEVGVLICLRLLHFTTILELLCLTTTAFFKKWQMLCITVKWYNKAQLSTLLCIFYIKIGPNFKCRQTFSLDLTLLNHFYFFCPGSEDFKT